MIQPIQGTNRSDEEQAPRVPASVWVSIAVCAALALTQVVLWNGNSASYIQLNWREPFGYWKDARDFFQNVGDVNPSTLPALQTQLLNATWCLTPSPRNRSTPSTRAGTCVCVANQFQLFQADVLANRSALLNPSQLAPVPQRIKDNYTNSVLQCWNKRAVWRIYACEASTCRFHPIVAAFYLSATLLLFLLLVAFKTASKRIANLRSRMATILLFALLVVVTPVVVFLALPDTGGLLYLAGVLWFCLTPFTILRDGQQTAEELLQTVLYTWPIIAFPAVFAWAAATNRMRDVYAVTSLGLLGALLALLWQRIHWSREASNITTSPDDKLKMPLWVLHEYVLAMGFTTLYILLCLTLWVHYDQRSPYAGSLGSILILTAWALLLRVQASYKWPDSVTLYIHLGFVTAVTAVCAVDAAKA
jgi:hypothetical protein